MENKEAIKSSTGEENETVIFQTRIVLYKLVKEEVIDKETKAVSTTTSWKEMGIGPIKILMPKKDKDGAYRKDSIPRILMRREVNTNRHGLFISLNLPLQKRMIIGRANEVSLRLSTAVIGANGVPELVTYLLRAKGANPDTDTTILLDEFQNCIKELEKIESASPASVESENPEVVSADEDEEDISTDGENHEASDTTTSSPAVKSTTISPVKSTTSSPSKSTASSPAKSTGVVVDDSGKVHEESKTSVTKKVDPTSNEKNVMSEAEIKEFLDFVNANSDGEA